MTIEDASKKNSEFTDRQLNMPMYYIKHHNQTPREAKFEIIQNTYNPSEESKKNISDAVDEVTRRLGLGPDETLYDKQKKQ